MEQIPRTCLNFDMVVMHKTDKILENSWYKMRISFKERAISYTDFHILQLNGRMKKASHICLSVSVNRNLSDPRAYRILPA